MAQAFARSFEDDTSGPENLPREHGSQGALGVLSAAFAAEPLRRRTHRYLLLLRFGVVNLVGIALLGAAYLQGWVGQIFAADQTRLTSIIFVIFVMGLGLCAWRIVQTSRELNAAKEFEPFAPKPSRALAYTATMKGRAPESRAISATGLRSKLMNRTMVIRNVANSLVFLGLIGTVIGFIIALSGVKPEMAAEAGSIGPMVSTLIDGMSVALYTTLVGAVLNVWLMVNFRLLVTGTVSLTNAIIELGEQHART
jgi:hypothetical protein